jgi:hypothetical protein
MRLRATVHMRRESMTDSCSILVVDDELESLTLLRHIWRAPL